MPPPSPQQQRLIDHLDLSGKLLDLADRDALLRTAMLLALYVARYQRLYGQAPMKEAIELAGAIEFTDEQAAAAADTLECFSSVLSAMTGPMVAATDVKHAH